MDKIARARSLGYLLHFYAQRCGNRANSFSGTVWYCSQASNDDDDDASVRKPNRLMDALKGLKIQKNVGQKIDKKQSMNSQNLDGGSLKKPVLLEALRHAVASLPEREKAEEELLTELEKLDTQTLAAKQISQRPDILQNDEEHRTESDLLQRLRSQQKPEEETTDLTSLMSEFRVQQPKEGPNIRENSETQSGSQFKIFDSQFNGDPSDTEEFKSSSQTLPYKRQRKRSLFERYRLNIFQPAINDENVPAAVDTTASIWEVEEQRTLRLLKHDGISNGFDEMSMLTEEGKLWQYPINNEQGMEAEMKVGFHEHVFLESHLEAFPAKGPIRHFMELVIHGLSMNPYITVQQKKDNIHWFLNYFKNKESLLKESGAIEQDFSFQEVSL